MGVVSKVMQMTIFIVSASEANFWWTHLKNYLITGKNLTDWREAFEVGEEGEDSELFSGYLSDFMFTPEGGVSTNNFRWAGDGELVCGEPAPNISVQLNLNDLKKGMIRCILTRADTLRHILVVVQLIRR